MAVDAAPVYLLESGVHGGMMIMQSVLFVREKGLLDQIDTE
jgi:hypothetical protein